MMLRQATRLAQVQVARRQAVSFFLEFIFSENFSKVQLFQKGSHPSWSSSWLGALFDSIHDCQHPFRIRLP